MLVLTRKIGERIIVSVGGETVSIELLGAARNRARVGVDANSAVVVHRQEVWNRIAAEGAVAFQVLPVVCQEAG